LEKHGRRFEQRCFTAAEVAYANRRPKRAAEHLAARFAAKEAVLKALGTGWIRGISWRDIEVRNNAAGTPSVRLYGGARDVMERSGIERIHLSLSHCRTHATATAIAEG
ncbi:MAG: holo-ACP synthase, partial [Planctomycetota bacterium]